MTSCLATDWLVAWLVGHQLAGAVGALLLLLAASTFGHRAGFIRGYERARRYVRAKRVIPSFHAQQGDV